MTLHTSHDRKGKVVMGATSCCHEPYASTHTLLPFSMRREHSNASQDHPSPLPLQSKEASKPPPCPRRVRNGMLQYIDNVVAFRLVLFGNIRYHVVCASIRHLAIPSTRETAARKLHHGGVWVGGPRPRITAHRLYIAGARAGSGTRGYTSSRTWA